MTEDGELNRLNRWYDELPPDWRFHLVLWPLLVLGACNMLLTFSGRFPFGLLLLLGILCVAAVRVPYVLERARPVATNAPAQTAGRGFRLESGWFNDLNQRYEAIPESRRIWVPTVILLVAGGINMMLTIHHGFPFGLLFLLALLVMVGIRAPWYAGVVRPAEAGTSALPDASAETAIGHADTVAAPAQFDAPPEPAHTGLPVESEPHAVAQGDEPPTAAEMPHAAGGAADPGEEPPAGGPGATGAVRTD